MMYDVFVLASARYGRVCSWGKDENLMENDEEERCCSKVLDVFSANYRAQSDRFFREKRWRLIRHVLITFAK